jgi:hypothetical protein
MKVILVCPAERTEVEALADAAPLVNVCILGKPFLHYWLEHLAECGAKEVKVLAVDRPEKVRDIVGNGARWGLRIEIVPESHELNYDEARRKYLDPETNNGLQSSNKIVLIDHLPGVPGQRLFQSYTEFFSAIQLWLSRNPTRQIGIKEIKPGIWAGLRTQISPHAKLHAPCWIGENVLIKSDAEIGPMVILENGVVVERGADISESWIGTETFVGSLTQVKDSLALGDTLVNLRTNSITKIPDAFLLCALKSRHVPACSGSFFARASALFVLVLSLPFALVTILKAKYQGHRALRPRRAAVPQGAPENSSSIVYFEFANANGWWKRWPQLWNVARGEFAWIGNRPLTPIEAGKLSNDFERLWLAAPVGLISQADAEGCTDNSSDEARAHASFYAAQANRRLDFVIFFRAMARLAGRKLAAPISTEATGFKTQGVELDRVVTR